MADKKDFPKIKSKLHNRNKNRERYDLKELSSVVKSLSPYVITNKYDDLSLDFGNPKAVNELNRALLYFHYGIKEWSIPANYLCPPVPGRADYVHYASDLLGKRSENGIPMGGAINCLDIGVGANCIYPIIGAVEYQWNFVGTDIDEKAIASAENIVRSNKNLVGKIECRLQPNKKDALFGAIKKTEHYELVFCNPPFYGSAKEAANANNRKRRNLKQEKVERNFGGQNNELWCIGGELKFLSNLINESKKFGGNVYWFTSLISRQTNVDKLVDWAEDCGAVQIDIIEMGQGNKTSRLIAWTFLSISDQKEWRKERWKNVKFLQSN